MNLYAHQRIPDNLTFVKNLLAVYSRRETADAAARLALLRTYWFHDPQLRAQLFEQMSRAGTLDRDLERRGQRMPRPIPPPLNF